MKAILEFELPEDETAHLRAVKATDLCSVLWQMDHWLRDQIKHNDKDWQEIRDKLYEFMGDQNISLDQIYQ